MTVVINMHKTDMCPIMIIKVSC